MQSLRLAEYASSPLQSKGRLYYETNDLDPFLSSFALDKTYIIESAAFRRLQHKTQVFVSHKNDHYRNRLTHSIETSHIASIIAKSLCLSNELSENLALTHDIGHAPFGHSGERALDELVQEYGFSFDHNTHAIKLLTELEKRGPNFNGLNLTWEFIEGMAKHNGPIIKPSNLILAYSSKHNLDLQNYSSLEAQVASIADDIAYNNHDIYDGFKAKLINITQLKEIDLLSKIIHQIEKSEKTLAEYQIIHQAVQMMKNSMIIDVIKQTTDNINSYNIKTSQDVRNAKRITAQFSETMEAYHKEIKKFLMENVYRHQTIITMNNKARKIIRDLFFFYMDDYKNLPYSWQQNIINENDQATVICDFIACMSDRYAIIKHREIFDML